MTTGHHDLPCTDRHPAALIGKFYGVTQEIDQDLAELLSIDLNLGQLQPDLGVELDAALEGLRSNARQGVLDQLGHVRKFEIERSATALGKVVNSLKSSSSSVFGSRKTVKIEAARQEDIQMARENL